MDDIEDLKKKLNELASIWETTKDLATLDAHNALQLKIHRIIIGLDKPKKFGKKRLKKRISNVE